MAKITAADVNKLRQQTGAGMMDCKKALVENDGDFEKAIEYLRKKGQKMAGKRADRDANEGIILAKVDDSKQFGVVLMLNCETDFVAKNQDFIDFANALTDKALELKVENKDALLATDFDGRTIDDSVTDMVGKIGEKLQIGAYDILKAEQVFAYNHLGNRLATLLGLNKKEVENVDEIGKQVAMQVAAMNPVAVDKDGVSAEIIEKEIEIGKDQARQEGKPEAILEKIAQGKLNKFFRENTLLNQDFVRDSSMNVGTYLKNADNDLTVTDFKRVQLGS